MKNVVICDRCSAIIPPSEKSANDTSPLEIWLSARRSNQFPSNRKDFCDACAPVVYTAVWAVISKRPDDELA